MTDGSVKQRSRFTTVDALRGVAALMVVLFHCWTSLGDSELRSGVPDWAGWLWSQLGLAGVTIFFVLSGFVIAHSLAEKRLGPGAIGRFLLKRSIRLDPPYWAAIVLTLAFTVALSLFGEREAAVIDIARIVAHVFYLQTILGYGQINMVFWTLCLEVQFYLIYVLVAASGRAMPCMLALCCTASLPWAFGIAPNPWPGLFLEYWYAFLAGAVSYWMWRRPSARLPGAAFLTALASAMLSGSATAVFAATGTAMLLYFAGISSWIFVGLNWRWLQYLGLISYSLYLTHGVALRAVSKLTGALFGPLTLRWQLAQLGAGVMLSLVLATVFWWLVERPSARLSKQIAIEPQQQASKPRADLHA